MPANGKATARNLQAQSKARVGILLGMSPAQKLVLTFVMFIAAGTGLLWLPAATPGSASLPWVDALFTATSAVCVTGLIVRDTAHAFTPWGQVVILILIKIGGLGYMLMASAAAVLAGRRIGVHERITIQQAMNLDTAEGLGRFVRKVILISLSLELLGTLVITWAYWPHHSPGRALALGVFHAVSGFNNAGFSLFSDNLMGEGRQPVAVAAIMVLAIVGGLGFFVLNEILGLFRRTRNPVRLSLHTKMVLATTATLLLLGMVGLHAVCGLNWGPALFLSSISRTAGFNIQDTGALPLQAMYLIIPLMFIGASPGGTGGGIKTTTFALVCLSVWNMLRGRRQVIAFHRRLTLETIYRALMVMVIMTALLVALTFVTAAWEGKPVHNVLFEIASALGTVGLSVGDGGNLSYSALFSQPCKLLVIFAMLVGRLGPLTLALAAASQIQQAHVEYPEGRVNIG